MQYHENGILLVGLQSKMTLIQELFLLHASVVYNEHLKKEQKDTKGLSKSRRRLEERAKNR